MKKNYMKPEGMCVSLHANENIAASGRPFHEFFFGVKYRDEDKDDPTNPIYLADSTILAADQTTPLEERSSNLIDWFAILFYGADSDIAKNCTYDPTAV